jgi:hypothetical protein
MVRENGPEQKEEKEAGEYLEKYSESRKRKPWTSVINQQVHKTFHRNENLS